MTQLRVARPHRTAASAPTLPIPAAEYSHQVLHGVPTFKALQSICMKYIAEHQFTLNVRSRPACTCRIELANYDNWLEHVTELQASDIAMAIQEARNTIES